MGDHSLKQIGEVNERKGSWLNTWQRPVIEMEKMIWVLQSASNRAVLLLTTPPVQGRDGYWCARVQMGKSFFPLPFV